ncbi:DUF2510 domain-containing protein [Cellulomonas sp. URHE0023]|uniref:DUF2510 domain-containing protein n=1 Tax=Cellulomonas sp. URHE0023 TaxID=1380354 RepID=UPI00048A12D1|nr:DUF2510 domain-containing protein [Cellulomonas sp. URHE0023]
MNDAEAGWYPDPKDPSGVRWFDGRFWTEHHGPTPTWQTPPSTPEPASSRPRVLVAAGITAGVLVLGLLVAAAVPVYREEHQRARLSALAATTCDDVADEAVSLALTEKQLEPLEAVTSAAVARDGRDDVQIPDPGAEAFVMSCSGIGTRLDGSSAPLTIDLYIDHEHTHLLWYTWDV